MKRRLDHAGDTSSLDLLLDTLCNVFGGIVLIACLLAILPRQQMPSPLLPSHAASSEMIERRIATAKQEIDRLQFLIDSLSTTTDPKIAALQARRDSLLKIQNRLEEEIGQRRTTEMSQAEAQALAMSGDPEILAERLQVLKLLKSKTEGMDSAATEKIRHLEQRSKLLSDEAEKTSKGRSQTVRFPRERPARSSPLPIIIRHNAVYPLSIGKEMEDNPAVGRIEMDDRDAFRARPIPGRGVHQPSENAELKAVLRAAKARNLYVSLYLYPDSHQIFPDLRDVLSVVGIPYGLEFVPLERELNFSSVGSAPPEL